MRQSPFSYGSRPPQRMRTWVLLAVIAGATLFVTILAGLLDSGGDASLDEVVATQAPVEIAATLEPEPTAVSAEVVPTAPAEANAYAAIQVQHDALSPTEWTTYARSLVNRRYQWTGVIGQVHSEQELWITMLGPADSAIPQVVLHLSSPSNVPEAGTTVTFIGNLSRVVVMNGQVMLHFTDVALTSSAE
ncbi:MAG: hypothetical protein ACYC6L_10930 [Anaerolineae bacterium]